MDDMFQRPAYLAWLHGAAAAACVAALPVGGAGNPAIGFPIAIAVSIALEIPSAPKPRKLLPIIHGSVRKGGMRRALFIREMFCLAVVYMAIANLLAGAIAPAISSFVIAAAMITSSAAGEVEASAMRRAMRDS